MSPRLVSFGVGEEQVLAQKAHKLLDCLGATAQASTFRPDVPCYRSKEFSEVFGNQQFVLVARRCREGLFPLSPLFHENERQMRHK